jgi:hypothetical protein
MCALPQVTYGPRYVKPPSRLADVAATDVARVWDDYLHRCGAGAYVRVRYVSGCDLPPLQVTQDAEAGDASLLRSDERRPSR